MHSFRIYVACALLAANCERWLIKRMLRWRGDESLEIYARVNDTEWSDWIGRTLTASVDSTIASRITDMDFSPEVIESHRGVAEAMLNINASAASSARGPM